MRTDFASWVACVSIESLLGKVFELLEDDKTTRLFELSREDMVRVFELSSGEEVVGKTLELFGEDATKVLELLEGEMTKTVDGDPVESAPAKLPIEPLIMDWPPPRVALITSAS